MTNPLRRDAFQPTRPLDWRQVVDERNDNMVRSDIEWAVNANGDGVYLLQSKDAQGGWQEWKPQPGEVEAINEVAARAINSGIDMNRWRAFVLDGTITREVQKVMQAHVR